MQSPTVMDAEEEEVLQVLEVCQTIEEFREVIVTTIEEDSNDSPPVASSGTGTKPSQVKLTVIYINKLKCLLLLDVMVL